jgi:YD repeat-containing protein
MKKILFAVTALFYLAHPVFAQLPDKVQENINRNMPMPVPPSPNVASLGKFGNYGVSYFSGLPEISIPLLEVKSGTLTLPITLSYHASGVKPTDVAGWVGMGWAISAGGQIARNIRNKPDEISYNQTPLNIGYLPVCGTTGTGYYNYLQDVVKGIKDTEPDIFDYSYPGGRGKFIVPYGEAPYLIPAAPVIINPFALEKFELRDAQGVLYKYGTGANATESNTSYSGGSSVNGVTAWYLTDMIAPNTNDQITFAYQDVGNVSTHDISYSQTITDLCNAANGGSCPPIGIPKQLNIDSYGSQRGVKTIFFENGKVEFNLSASKRTDALATDLFSLQSLQLYQVINGNYALVKTIQFSYSYFTDAGGGPAKLKLDAVYFVDNVGSRIQQFKLSYFTNSFSWNPATNFLNQRDLWGYYNGASQNTDLILPTTIDFQATSVSPVSTYSFGGAVNREVNTQYVKEGVLSRITFPTGGYTQFDFEPNQYLNGSTPRLAGGLRVSKITTSDGSPALPVVKSFRYGINESGYGVANFSMRQFSYFSEQRYYSDCEPHQASSSYRARTYYSNSSFSLNPFDAAPVFYNYVTEYLGDPDGTTSGKTIYEYDQGVPITDEVEQAVPNSGKYYRPSFGWKRGKLTKKSVYNSTNILLAQTEIQYTLYNATTGNGKQIGLGAAQYIEGNNACSLTGANSCLNEAGTSVNQNTFFSTLFTQHTGIYLKSSVNELVNDSNTPSLSFLTTTSILYHTPKLQIKQTTTGRSSSQEQSVTVNTYPFELAANSSSTGAAEGVYLMNSKNILTIPLETYTMLQNSDGSNQRVVSAQVMAYRKNAANTNQVVPDKVYFLESSSPINKTAYTSVAINSTNDGLTMNSSLKPRIQLVTYDGDGNIQVVSRVNDLSLAYLYGYNNALPIAQVSNAMNTELMVQNFEDLAVSASILRSTTAHTGYQYYQGDFTVNFTPPNTKNYVVDYWYLDASARWQYLSKDYTGTGMVLAEGTAIDDVRVYPKDARCSSFTYDPATGKTSEIDPGGKTVFYEYDAFGRLQLVRDQFRNVIKAYDYHYQVQN